MMLSPSAAGRSGRGSDNFEDLDSRCGGGTSTLHPSRELRVVGERRGLLDTREVVRDEQVVGIGRIA